MKDLRADIEHYGFLVSSGDLYGALKKRIAIIEEVLLSLKEDAAVLKGVSGGISVEDTQVVLTQEMRASLAEQERRLRAIASDLHN